ncbi:MAG TPA: TIGR03619 family F420-dependent LLM class oxidoreductase [Steroidobacteraceae bacterium]|nr:TIGR03619 family F420-dependent LLM class oxidoreductase [Steroidobacteraceae bacterium]
MSSVCIGVFGLQNWFAGDFAPVIELAALAERAGIDEISITDHVVMGEATHKYPYGKFPTAPDFAWFEPLTFLAAVAGATRHIRLGTAVVIAPLRPAPLLAKQVATLDALSHGRVDLGVGVGWQEEEYAACAVPFEARYRMLDEQMRACRLLWSEAPATFHGEFWSFERIWCKPFPVQQRIPVLHGVKLSPKSLERIAAHGDGWIPMEQEPARIAAGAAALRAAFRARGRSPDEVRIRAVPKFRFRADGSADLDAALAEIPRLREAGATMIELHAYMYCRGPQDFESFCGRLAACKR